MSQWVYSYTTVRCVFQDGKDMRHLAASLTFHDIVAIIDHNRFSIVRHD